VQPSIVALSQLNEDLAMHFHSDHGDLMRCHRGNPRRHLLWGFALVALGTIFLMDRLAWLDLPQYLGPQTRWWHFLPLLLALGGVIRLLTAHSARQVVKGLSRIGVGVWLCACLEQLGGLTFANSWPVLLVAVGAQMLVHGWFGWGKKHCDGVTS
jgi:peptidoglycan/LPS O-acetylase OafA/YrhL